MLFKETAKNHKPTVVAWVNEMRSGIPQTHPALCVVDADGTIKGECCLGVLCRVLNFPFEEDGNTRTYKVGYPNLFRRENGTVVDLDRYTFIMPDNDILAHPFGAFEPDYPTLADMNDQGVDFSTIADIIIKRWNTEFPDDLITDADLL